MGSDTDLKQTLSGYNKVETDDVGADGGCASLLPSGTGIKRCGAIHLSSGSCRRSVKDGQGGDE